MNTTRTWTLALLAGLFGAGDWFLATLPADEKALQEPVLTVGNAVVSAALREVETDGNKERHLFLNLKGEGSGTIKVRLSSTTTNPMARMMPRPKTLWEKDLAVDTGKATVIDLGALAEGTPHTFFNLAASNDGKTFVSLLDITPRAAKLLRPVIDRTEL